jgi:hypothetical protein
MGAGADAGAAGIYDAALQKRQALMGKSGARALLKNIRVFSIASFACIGGVLYGYNQGMFSGVLAMPAFQRREFVSFLYSLQSLQHPPSTLSNKWPN